MTCQCYRYTIHTVKMNAILTTNLFFTWMGYYEIWNELLTVKFVNM